MIIILSVIIFIGLSALFFVYTKKDKKESTIYLNEIKRYLNKKLDLNDSIAFLNTARIFDIYLINLKQQDRLPEELEQSTHELLGMILQIPRLSEKTDDISEVIKQIATITESSEDISSFFEEHFDLFKKYLK